jgi:hypothetical protein
MEVAPPLVVLLTSGNVIDLTVLVGSTGTVVAYTYTVSCCELPEVLLRYGSVAAAVSVAPGPPAQSLEVTVSVDELPSV